MLALLKDKFKVSTGSHGKKFSISWENIQTIAFGLVFAILTFWNTCHIWAMLFDMHMNDFGKFYYATVDFLNKHDMYGPNPATFIQVTDTYGQHFWNLNPPHFHILLLPFALLPEHVAFIVWTAVNFVGLFLSLHWIQSELKLTLTPTQQRWLTIGFLAFAGTGAHFVTGQLSFLLVLPVTLAWIHARHNRWTKVGLYLGIAASIKLFLLIFIPYLLIRRQLHAIAIFGSVLIGAFGIGCMVFGMDIHMQWISRLSDVNWYWASMNASLLGTLSRIFAESPTFEVVIQANTVIFPLWYGLCAILALVAYCVSAYDSSIQTTDRSFSILLLSAILISPLGWIYYHFLLMGPLTAVIVHWYTVAQSEFSNNSQDWRRIQIVLLTGSIPGFLVPLVALILFEQSPLYTISMGSSYFWSTLMIWTFIFIDWRRDNLEWSWPKQVSLKQSQKGLHRASNRTRHSL